MSSESPLVLVIEDERDLADLYATRELLGADERLDPLESVLQIRHSGRVRDPEMPGSALTEDPAGD
jgi:hypothetical protein